MAARRCSTCGLNFGLEAASCSSCGGSLWYARDLEPDGSEKAPDDDVAGVFLANGKVEFYRFERFLILGLDIENAERASIERNRLDGGFRVDLHVFEGLLKRGATADQAFRILF